MTAASHRLIGPALAATLVGVVAGCASAPTMEAASAPPSSPPPAAEEAAEQGLVAGAGIAGTALAACPTDLGLLNQVSGWQADWPQQWASVAASAPNGDPDAVETWARAPAALGRATADLRAGLEAGRAAPRPTVERVLQQVRDLHAALEAEGSDYRYADAATDDAARWNRLMSDDVAPAVASYADFLESEYLPAARTSPGLSDIDGGATCFASAVTFWTSLSPDLSSIEAIGRRMIDEARAELRATARDGESVEQILERLRRHDRDTSEDELMDISRAAIARAQAAAPSAFAADVVAEVAVVAMPAHMQPSFPAGMYSPAQNGAAAQYLINPSRAAERRLMAEVIAFHETVPGHHLFAAYPRSAPEGRGNSGILEGWAIYAEYLADELGLYSDTLDRQGMITKHMWAASRLVVEPGLHLHGWSREDAIAFMLANTVLSRDEIEIEVDRYITMPGQSLSYMLGADLLLTERARARDRLGESFDLAAFHDVVLAPGARALPQVRADIRAWADGG